MSDLRTAALRALEVMSDISSFERWSEVRDALKAALAEPQEPVQHEYEVTANDDGTFSVELPDGEELRIIPPQRPAAPIIQPEIKDDKPFGYFRAEPFGWTDCAPTDEGAIPLYERPQQPPTPPEVQTEAEKVAYCAGWWAALEAERKELLRIAEEQK